MRPQLGKSLHVSEREAKFYFMIRLNSGMRKKYELYLFKTSCFMPRNQQFVVKWQQKNVFWPLYGLQIWCPTKNMSPTDTGMGSIWCVTSLTRLVVFLVTDSSEFFFYNKLLISRRETWCFKQIEVIFFFSWQNSIGSRNKTHLHGDFFRVKVP